MRRDYIKSIFTVGTPLSVGMKIRSWIECVMKIFLKERLDTHHMYLPTFLNDEIDDQKEDAEGKTTLVIHKATCRLGFLCKLNNPFV